MKILATSTPKPWEQLQKRIEERRSFLENARTMNVRRLKADVERIAKRETEYVQRLAQEIIPVKVTWNEEAVQKLSEFVPFKIEAVKSEETKDGDMKQGDMNT